MHRTILKAAVTGAGPAGISAALQLCRYGFDVTIFEKNKPGGLLNTAGILNNFPGFPDGISGPSLVRRLLRQLELSGVLLIRENVEKITIRDNRVLLETSSEKHICDIAVIATGTVPLKPDKLFADSKLIKYDITKIRNLSGKNIGIIGGGDAAFDYALTSGRKNRVSILIRSENHSCIQALFTQVSQNPAITVLKKTIVRTVTPSKNKIAVEVCTADKTSCMEFDHLIYAVGRVPDDRLLTDSVIRCSRIRIAGDVRNGKHRQTSIACGDGIRAAMELAEVYR